MVIGILAVRTLEEGLQPAREVERYTRYRSSLMSLLGRFDRATSPKDKLRIMHEVERTSYQEMRQFLKTNYEARYVSVRQSDRFTCSQRLRQHNRKGMSNGWG